jgi:hypothetical protein
MAEIYIEVIPRYLGLAVGPVKAREKNNRAPV